MATDFVRALFQEREQDTQTSMFEFVTNPEERGQVGIGTLIVFIAMVLVAAIAAGVLINTAGFLQTTASEAGEESTEQVTNQIVVTGATGQVSDSDTVEEVTIVVRRGAGSDEINLSRTTIRWIGPTEAKTLTWNNTADGGNFTTEDIQGTTNDGKVLATADARAEVIIDVTDVEGSDGLTEGQQVELQITTPAGGQTPYYLNVPESLQGKNTVPL